MENFCLSTCLTLEKELLKLQLKNGRNTLLFMHGYVKSLERELLHCIMLVLHRHSDC